MTDGHKHREIRLRAKGPLLHLLQTPLARSADMEQVEKSHWVWYYEGMERHAGDGPLRGVPVFRLTPLGILHTLFGLTVRTEDG